MKSVGFFMPIEIWLMMNKKKMCHKLMTHPLDFSRCLAESNRSTRFCRPLPNRSVKTPCRLRYCISHLRLQRYYFYLVPPNFFPTFSCFFFTFLEKRASSALIIVTFQLRFAIFPYNNSGIHKACHYYYSYYDVLKYHKD